MLTMPINSSQYYFKYLRFRAPAFTAILSDNRFELLIFDCFEGHDFEHAQDMGVFNIQMLFMLFAKRLILASKGHTKRIITNLPGRAALPPILSTQHIPRYVPASPSLWSRFTSLFKRNKAISNWVDVEALHDVRILTIDRANAAFGVNGKPLNIGSHDKMERWSWDLDDDRYLGFEH